ncbi:MAG: hypothetical protein IIX09_04995 [Clostridia bacterium]|nr:hypothetical protein [Clostridia bacterium]
MNRPYEMNATNSRDKPPGLSAEYDKVTVGDMLARQARYTLCVRYNRRMAIAICCKFCEFATRGTTGDS